MTIPALRIRSSTCPITSSAPNTAGDADLGYPGTVLFSFDGDDIEEIDYRDTKRFVVTRDFLNSPERFFKHLFASPDDDVGDE